MFKRRIDDLGRIVLPKEIRKELGLAEGDEMEIKLVDGVITISKPLVIEVHPICGLSLQKVDVDGINFDIIEVYEEQDVNEVKFYVFVYKCYRRGKIQSIDCNSNIEETLMKDSVMDYLKDGYIII